MKQYSIMEVNHYERNIIFHVTRSKAYRKVGIKVNRNIRMYALMNYASKTDYASVLEARVAHWPKVVVQSISDQGHVCAELRPLIVPGSA